MDGLTEGRNVHYVLVDGPNAGQHRPAIVTRVTRNGDAPPPDMGLCDLEVFTSLKDGIENFKAENVEFSNTETPGTWHWIESA